MTEQSSIVTVEDKQETLIGKVCNPWMWRVANGFMALFFAFASYVQVSPPYFELIMFLAPEKVNLWRYHNLFIVMIR